MRAIAGGAPDAVSAPGESAGALLPTGRRCPHPAPRMIYLDHNATTPIAPEVRETVLPHLTDEWGNPSSAYRFGAKLKGVLEQARERVAE